MMRAMDATYRRPVSTIEKLYLAFDRARPPFANQLCIEGEGRVDEAELRDAVARAGEANPGARLVLDGHMGRAAWVPRPGGEARVFVQRNARWDGRSEDGATFLDRRLDRRGPTCEVQLIESARSYLIFRSMHAVMDGLGTLYWAQDVMRALRGEAPIGHPSAITDTELAAGLTDGAMTLPPKDALHPCGKADDASSGNDFRWRRITIARPKDVPIVAALAVTIARAARRHEAGAVRFNVPADLRFFRQDQRSTGNLIGTLFVEVGPAATIEQVAADLKQRLRAKEHARFPARYTQLRWLPMGAYQGMVTRDFAREHERGRYAIRATLSVLGAVAPATVAAQGFTPTAAWWIPPTADQTCFVAVSKLGGALEVALAMPHVLGTRGRFDALADELTAALTA